MLLMERAALIVFLRMTFYFLFDIWIDTVRHAAYSFSFVFFFFIIFFRMLPHVKTDADIITFRETCTAVRLCFLTTFGYAVVVAKRFFLGKDLRVGSAGLHMFAAQRHKI